MKTNFIEIKGARENNLKNIDLKIPKEKLVVITGVSGSGKSSLAFDTIYKEGRRRYLESLSSYARQFLGGNEKPLVDSIEGLSPSISIDQKTTNHNPRSTVGTVTEIYDYLRLLFSRVGTPYCPNGHGVIMTLTNKQIIQKIFEEFDIEDRIQILSPQVEHEKGTHKALIEQLRVDGYVRVRIDGVILSLDDEINLERTKFHDIDLVIDRIVLNKDQETMSRLNDDIELISKLSNGNVVVVSEKHEKRYNKSHSCKVCGFSIKELEPRMFSFNSPVGACPKCNGLGITFEPDEEKMTPDKNMSINQGAVRYFKNTMNTTSIEWQKFNIILNYYKINRDIPVKDLKKEDLDHMFYGSDEEVSYTVKSASGNVFTKTEKLEGILSMIKRRHMETSSESAREFYSFYMSKKTCDLCNGKRLSKASLCVLINGKNIIEVTDMSISKILDFFLNVTLNEQQKQIAELVLKEIISRLSFLSDVGLEYLNLSRSASTLSGGEAQRTRLATQIGSSLTGVLYVLDEPSIGLHQKDNDKLIATLKNMRDIGNSLILVEHDEDTMLAADYIIDIGPGAGSYGGKVIASGTPQEIMKDEKSLTGKYLSGKEFIQVPKTRRGGNGQKIIITGANENNLQNINVTFPLGKLVVVTGVSGSGKSTLVNETLAANINKILFDPFAKAGKIKNIVGIDKIDKLILVSQEPIGRTPRSNPATYIGVFDDIRELYASTQEAKARGYTKGRFSFNTSGGRCEKCQGDGYVKISMHFLPDVYVKCDECLGKKYNDETLTIKYKSKSIFDVLDMSGEEALEFFGNIPNIRRKLELLNDVGLGYLKLGTPSTKLSGGEAQRIKIAKFLQRKASKDTIIILDEPTTGLHMHDIKKLVEVLNKIVDQGTTVIVIEHNLDLIKCADHIIDLGPDGGDYGGRIMATGTPEQIINKSSVSYTAKYLEKYIK